MKYNSKVVNARRTGMADADWARAPESTELARVSGEFYYCKALQTLRSHIEQSLAQIMPNI